MASKSTKTVSVRLPIEEYAKLLKRASDQKMNISDFLITKIYSSGDLAPDRPDGVDLVTEDEDEVSWIDAFDCLANVIGWLRLKEDSAEITEEDFRTYNGFYDLQTVIQKLDDIKHPEASSVARKLERLQDEDWDWESVFWGKGQEGK